MGEICGGKVDLAPGLDNRRSEGNVTLESRRKHVLARRAPIFAIYNSRVSQLKCDQIGGNGAI